MGSSSVTWYCDVTDECWIWSISSLSNRNEQMILTSFQLSILIKVSFIFINLYDSFENIHRGKTKTKEKGLIEKHGLRRFGCLGNPKVTAYVTLP